jgi:chromosome segregation ATPase
MTGETVASIVASLVVGLGGGGAFVGYWRDRKKIGAEGEVATATVELQIDAARLQNAESRLALTQRAWDEERLSFERRIDRLEDELATERLESERKDAKILDLESRLNDLQAQMSQISRELSDLRGTA